MSISENWVLNLLVTGADKGKRDIDGVSKAVEKTGKKSSGAKKGVKDLSTSADKLTGSFDDLHSGLVTINTGIELAGRVAGAAAKAVKLLGDQLYQLGMRGGEVSAVASAFERMATPRMLMGLRSATGGLIRDIDLMRESTQAMRANLQSEDEITRWYAAVTRGAQDVGESVPRMIETLGNMLAGGGMEEVLGKLGVSVSGLRDSVRSSGETMESESGRAHALSLALVELETSVGGVDCSTSNLNDSWSALGVTAGNYYDETARGFAENENLLGLFIDINEALGGTNTEFDTLGSALADGIDAVLEWGLEAVAVFREVYGGISEITQAWHEYNAAVWRAVGAEGMAAAESERAIAAGRGSVLGRQGAGSIREGIDRRALERRQREIADANELYRNERGEAVGRHGGRSGGGAIAAQMAEMERRHGRESRRGGRGGGGGARQEVVDPLWDELIDDAGEALTRLAYAEELVQEQVDARSAQVALEIEQEQELVDSRSARVELELEGQLAIREEMEKQLDLLDALAQKERAVHEERLAGFTENIDKAIQYTDAMITVGGAIANVFDVLASAEGTSEADAKRYKKVKGSILAAISFVEAAIEYGRGIADFAGGNYGSGAMHVAAGVALTVAGGLALSQLGGSASPGAGSPASYTPTRQVEQRDEGGGGGQQVIIYTMGSSSARLGQELREADWQLQRSGMDAPMAGAGGYG